MPQIMPQIHRLCLRSNITRTWSGDQQLYGSELNTGTVHAESNANGAQI
jgi:hypothetical protein